MKKVGDRLRKWSIQVRNARAETIADITKEAIKDLASEKYFDLPHKFTSYVEDYERREGALQSIADYRDHFIHPFHVFCLGYRILNRWILGKSSEEIGKIPLSLTELEDPDYNLKVWFVASIYHDVGFPLEKLEILIQDFFKVTAGREMKSQFDWSPVLVAGNNIGHIHRLAELFGKKSGNKHETDINFERWFYKRLLEDHDHGALTALMLLNQDWGKRDKYDIADEAALAIALHSYRYNTKEESKDINLGQLKVEDLPLAFFLSFCDSAQEWGRKVLLELIKKGSKSEIVNSVQYLGGLNSQLRPPVPAVIKETINNIEKIKTTVLIKYPTGVDGPIGGDKTLKEVFIEFADRFQSTWYLKNSKETEFWIEGCDVDDELIGRIHPSLKAGSPK
ncbi:MAG: hypothetical protein MUO97_12190 [Dehalococcoidia bacterium]|nr:hypothetical protein [Dehalococcoidia bacterium]